MPEEQKQHPIDHQALSALHEAIIEASDKYENARDPELKAYLLYYIDKLSDAAVRLLGVETQPEEQPKKKRKSNMSPEARQRAAERMRAMVANRRAEKQSGGQAA